MSHRARLPVGAATGPCPALGGMVVALACCSAILRGHEMLRSDPCLIFPAPFPCSVLFFNPAVNLLISCPLCSSP